MLEHQVAELLAVYLSRFIEDVNAAQLEISLWSGHVVLNNVHLRADVLERITALLHGEADNGSSSGASPSPASAASHGFSTSPSSSAAAADTFASPSTASMRMLLAPFTVVKGVIRQLIIRVPWASLESEPIHVQVTGVELVLGPLRARPYNAWEEQEREEAIKQQQLREYEKERQRVSGELANCHTSRSSSCGVAAAAEMELPKKAKRNPCETAPAATANATEESSWFTWIWDFDRIGQIAVRNAALTLRDVSLRYEFDYDGLHPSLASAFSVFVSEIRLATTNQQFREVFVSDLLSPLCKKILLSGVVVSTHAVRHSEPQQSGSAGRDSRSGKGRAAHSAPVMPMGKKDSPVTLHRNDGVGTEAAVASKPQPAQLPSPEDTPSGYDVYQAQWAYSKTILHFTALELQAKVVPPGCVSSHPIVDDAPTVAKASATELTIVAANGVQADLCFGVIQVWESMWRSYQHSLSCARYRKRLHLLRVNRGAVAVAVSDSSLCTGSANAPAAAGPAPLSTSRQAAQRRWRFALRCVLDDVQQQRRTVHRQDRSRREVIEGMLRFSRLRRSYCQFWKRTQDLPWTPPLDALEEKKLLLMERQLSLPQVIFLRCLSYAEMLQEQDDYARQQAFIEEARQRRQRAAAGAASSAATAVHVKQSGLWSWFSSRQADPGTPAEAATGTEEHTKRSGSAASHQSFTVAVDQKHGAGTRCVSALPPQRRSLALVDLLNVEWELGERYTAPHRHPIAKPSVLQSPLSEASTSNPVFFTLRCLVETLTVQLDPTYWPLRQDSSVPAPPMDTPLRRLHQEFCVHLAGLELFYSTVPDDRPDKASWSFFVGSARLLFDGALRSVLLQSKEDAGEDFIVMKQNALRTHVGVWVAPQLIICQPFHEWSWWGAEVDAFLAWFRAVQDTFYTPNGPACRHGVGGGAAAATTEAGVTLEDTPLTFNVVTHAFANKSGSRRLASGAEHHTPDSQRSSRFPQSSRQREEAKDAATASARLVWNVTIRAIDVCIPLFARDITDADLDIVEYEPSAFSSLAMLDSASTAIPMNNRSPDGGWQDFSATEPLDQEGEAGKGEMKQEHDGAFSEAVGAAAAAATVAAAGGGVARTQGILQSFAADSQHVADDETDSLAESQPDSFAYTKAERCFLCKDACLVLSISTTRLCTVPVSAKRYQDDADEYYLCIGDHDKAVRLFCQHGFASTALMERRQLDLLTFVAGEVLLNSKELTVLFNKGIDMAVEPDALAVLNDALLKPVVLTATDDASLQVQSVVRELCSVNLAAHQQHRHGGSGSDSSEKSFTLPWRLVSAGCVEICVDCDEGDGTAEASTLAVTRQLPEHCVRHILTAVTPSLQPAKHPKEVAAAADETVNTSSDPFGGRTVALGIGVARLSIRSALNDDLAEVVLVAPEEVPAATAPYRGALAALGAQEPRAIELAWDTSSLRRPEPCASGDMRDHASTAIATPHLLLSVPDITMTTAAGQKLLTVEQLTVVKAQTPANAPADVSVTVETVSAYFDVVLVELMEILLGTAQALRRMDPLPVPHPAWKVPPTRGTQHAAASAAVVPKVRLAVHSTQLQIPLTTGDENEGTPYAEVTARVVDFSVTLEPLLTPSAATPPPHSHSNNGGYRIHVELSVPEAHQLVDYTGGDPEVHDLITPYPWRACAGREMPLSAVVPLHVDVFADVPQPTSSTPSSSAAATAGCAVTTCKVHVSGGAIHAYFPFLYLYLDALNKDTRLQRLSRLPQSRHFLRGFTLLPPKTELAAARFASASTGYSRHTPAPPPVTSPPGFRSGGATTEMVLTASLCDVDIFLPTDAAVAVNLSNPGTACVVRLAEVTCGVKRTATNAPGTPLLPLAQLRTRAYLDTVAVHLLDLVSSGEEVKHVRLPNLKWRVDAGVRLVPKEDLTGYTYERGMPDDMTVLLGIHPPPLVATSEQANHAPATAETAQASPLSSGVAVELNDFQFRSLLRFFARNMARPAVAAVRQGSDGDPMHYLNEPMPRVRNYRKHTSHSNFPAYTSTDEATEAPAAASTAALTIFVTLPQVSVVIHADETVPRTLLSDDDSASGSVDSTAQGKSSQTRLRSIAYEFAVRRGAQFYAASGGPWTHSPVKNGEMSGLVMNAWERDTCRSDGAALTTTAPAAATAVHRLFAADLVGMAFLVSTAQDREANAAATPITAHEGEEEDTILEGEGGAAGVNRTAIGPLTRVAAAVRNATVCVPHVHWWLRLYTVYTESTASFDDYVSSALGASSMSMSHQQSGVGGPGSGATLASPPAQGGATGDISGGSSLLLGPHGATRPAYREDDSRDWLGRRPRVRVESPHASTAAAAAAGGGERGNVGTDAAPPRWLYGSVDFTNTQVSFGDHDVAKRPWCRLLVPETRFTVSPAVSAGDSSVRDEFVLDLPACPELLLRDAEAPRQNEGAFEGKHGYVSVLRLQPLTGNQAKSASSSYATVRMTCVPRAKCIAPLRYGRSYHMTELALHRTCAVHVLLSRLVVHIPAKELFEVVQEVLRQSREVRSLWEPSSDDIHNPALRTPQRATALAVRPPVRTYTAFEAELVNVGVIVLTESVKEGPGDADYVGVQVASARLTSEVELRSALTTTGEPATLMDEGLASDWQMRVWHSASTAILRGVVLRCRHAAEAAEWKLPVMRVRVSLPLSGTLFCVRANRAACVGDDMLNAGRAPPQTNWWTRTSLTEFYCVEPTTEDVCCELSNHLLSSVLVKLGDETTDEEKEEEAGTGARSGASAKPLVELPLRTIYTLCQSATKVLTLWRRSEVVAQAGMADLRFISSESLPSRDVNSHAATAVMWYEAQLSLSGHRLRVVSHIPAGEDDATAHNAARHCVMDITLPENVTFQLNRELHDENDEQLQQQQQNERDVDEHRSLRTHSEVSLGESTCEDDMRTVIVVIREQYRLSVGAASVHDVEGNLIYILSREDVANGTGNAHADKRDGSVEKADARAAALTVEYAPADGAVRVLGGHVLMAACPVVATFVVDWYRAYQTWMRLWTAETTATSDEKTDERQRTAEAPQEEAPLPTANGRREYMSLELQQAELLLAPAGYIVIRQPRISRAFCVTELLDTPTVISTPQTEGKEKTEYEMSCDTLCCYSTVAPAFHAVQTARRRELLARVTFPSLTWTYPVATSSASAVVRCRVPNVSLYNCDLYSWALCALRANAFWSAASAAWIATQPTVREVTQERATAEKAERTESKPGAQTSHQLQVGRTELLCFPAQERVGNATTAAVRFVAEDLELLMPTASTSGRTTVSQASSTGHITSVASLYTRVSATYRTADDSEHHGHYGQDHPLLEESEVSVTLKSRTPADHTGVSRETELRLCVAERGIRLHLPTGGVLSDIVSALWMVAAQHVPRQHASNTVESAALKVTAAAGETFDENLWRVIAEVPHFVCDVTHAAVVKAQCLALLEMTSIYGEVKTRGRRLRPQVEFRVARVAGQTDVQDPLAHETALTTFLSISPLASSTNTTAAASTQSAALFIQQQFLALSLQDDGHRDHDDDEATALTVRLHQLHVHPSLALLQSVSAHVLRPLVSAVRVAVVVARTAAKETVIRSLCCTVLHVRHRDAVLPSIGELERHAALVRVVEIESDWTLSRDLWLGGGSGNMSGDTCGIQLHFRNTGRQNVLTVRGESPADHQSSGGNHACIHLSCCEGVNGDSLPAIRVDSDLTVRFEKVTVVVHEASPHVAPDAFVELGDRSLCIFPPTAAGRGVARSDTAAAVAATTTAAGALTDVSTPSRSGASSWVSTSVYSADVKIGFHGSLTAGRRCLASTGTLQARYRLEEKRKGAEVLRGEQDGEATLHLQHCRCEGGPLTHTPTAFVARLCCDVAGTTGAERRLRVTLDMGTTRWRLPLGDVHVLMAVVNSLQAACAAPVSASTSPVVTPRQQHSTVTASTWVPPPTLDRGRRVQRATPPTRSTPLDVEWEMPSWSLTLTDDVQQPLAQFHVRGMRVQCVADTELSDVVVKAAGAFSITDSIAQTCQSDLTTPPLPVEETDKSTTEPTASRLLFAATTAVSLTWTRFSHDSHSLAVSVNVDDVVATLPLVTAVRMLRVTHTAADDGTQTFWNESGVDLEVSAASKLLVEDGDDGASMNNGSREPATPWRLPASHSAGLIATSIPCTQSKLTLSAAVSLPAVTNPWLVDRSSAGAASSSSTPVQQAASDKARSVTVDLRRLGYGAVQRVRLSRHAAAHLGSLDLLLEKTVRDNRDVVHIFTAVRLTNTLFPCKERCGTASAAARSIRLFAGDTCHLTVAPRATHYVPLPILHDRFTLEMNECAYATPAQLLTWAMLADAMTVLDDQTQKNDTSSGEKEAMLCGQLRQLDAATVTFPVLLGPIAPSFTNSVGTTTPSLAESSNGTAADSLGLLSLPTPAAAASTAVTRETSFTKPTTAMNSAPPASSSSSRVVQLTWQRHRSTQPPSSLFTGRLPPCEYTVSVEPVWTLWNRTGCRMRLRLRRPAENVTVEESSAKTQSSLPSLAAASLPTSSLFSGAVGDLIESAEIAADECFQWIPPTLDMLREPVNVYLQIEAPQMNESAPSPEQQPCPATWWTAAAALSLQEKPPPYIRLHQSRSDVKGAVRVERFGASTVVVRCAALLRSGLHHPVYLRDTTQHKPLLGTNAQGRLGPQQLLPLFYSEYVTTLAPQADRVGFTVLDQPPPLPMKGTGAEKEETDPYIVTSPVVATVLSADEREDCTLFYTVAGEASAVMPVVGKPANASSLFYPTATPILQLRSLCVVRNTDPKHALLVRPFAMEENGVATMTAADVEDETWCIPPGGEREMLRFSAHAEEPEVQFCYSDASVHLEDATSATAAEHVHTWSPPVKLLSLATSTLPLVLKHTCRTAAITANVTAEGAGDAFHACPMPRRTPGAASSSSVVERFHCLTLQSSTADGRLSVAVGFTPAPPLRIVNRLKTTLQFAQLLTKRDSSAGGKDASSNAATAAMVASPAPGRVSTSLCSCAPAPWSYLVGAEANSDGCWEVPTSAFQGIRVTLHSNVRKGFTASVDVDVLQCAAAPATGVRVGQTDAYVYVNLDHTNHQYTVTVVSTRQLESRMLFQPRRLTQLEVLVPHCTVALAAITLPTSGAYAQTSRIAPEARGRLRVRPSHGCYEEDSVVGESGSKSTVPLTATDDDILAVLRQQEMDVLLVRLVGVYGTLTMTERHLVGSASLALLEVVDCTTVEPVYPVVLRMGPRDGVSGGSGSTLSPSGGSGGAAAVGTTTLSESGLGVRRVMDPSWCSADVHLTRPNKANTYSGGDFLLVPIQHLRVTVAPVTVQLHDDFLFTLRTSFERLQEELAVEADGAATTVRTSLAPMPMGTDSTTYTNTVFLYELHTSPVATTVTYTRASNSRYNPFRGLGTLPLGLIPSVEGVGITLPEVTLRDVELPSTASIPSVLTALLWPKYRTQLLLQSYKFIGSLDMLGNPRALLGSWSRGVWELVTNASGKSRWVGTRDFLRTSTSSTLHSVGVLARSIGSLAGGVASSTNAAAATAALSTSLRSAESSTTDTRRGVFGEVLAEVGGGVSDAVQKPLRGARERGVNGFFVGMASGMVGLVGRPVFGLFRGVSVTSEFYARLLGGQSALSYNEACRMGRERNYEPLPQGTSSSSDAAAGSSASSMAATTKSPKKVMRAAGSSGGGEENKKAIVVLTSASFQQALSDIPRWRRGDEKSVRLAVERVGVRNAVLHIPYAAVTAFLSLEEFRASLSVALAALVAARLHYALTHPTDRRRSPHTKERRARDRTSYDEGQAKEGSRSMVHVAREYDRAAHIKASLGTAALPKYVTSEVCVRVCSLAEMEMVLSATEQSEKLVVSLAKAVNTAADQLFAP